MTVKALASPRLRRLQGVAIPISYNTVRKCACALDQPEAPVSRRSGARPAAPGNPASRG